MDKTKLEELEAKINSIVNGINGVTGFGINKEIYIYTRFLLDKKTISRFPKKISGKDVVFVRLDTPSPHEGEGD